MMLCRSIRQVTKKKGVTMSMIKLQLVFFVIAATLVGGGLNSPFLESRDPWGTYVGKFYEVRAYSNGTTNYLGPYDTYGYRYQCVEWINRFYVQMMLHKNMRGSGDANQYYDKYESLGLNRYPNGGTEPPQPKDILCSNGGLHGHVAIVREVGSNYVKVIQQNWYNDYRDSSMTLSMTVSGGHYTVSGFNSSYPIQGWLRKPPIAVYDYVHHIEDNWPEFTRYGPSNYWYEYTFDPANSSNTIGVCRNHLWWTYSNGNTISNYGIWRPNLAYSGDYEIFVFVPANYATTQNAKYEIHHANGTTIVPVNQNNYYGIFVSLGQFRFNAGTSGYVLLADNTGEPVQSRMIAFDDIAFVYKGEGGPVEEARAEQSGVFTFEINNSLNLSSTKIKYGLPKSCDVSLKIYNIAG
uniref:CHAP domain-containing protein n=1 Tax=candidate division WOR-3 bacterium TaxID=2052148 RepID=A0A7V3RIG8_UNCW3